MQVAATTIKNPLTKTSGFLADVSTHSLNPYAGCAFGNALCGVGCYAQHNAWIAKGRRWGDFLEIRRNTADAYLANVAAARAWAKSQGRPFSIFCASSTDPFVPQERKEGVTLALLEAMTEQPPDELVIQTHSHMVAETIYAHMLMRLNELCSLRVHVSMECDQDKLPGLPPAATPIRKRIAAGSHLAALGVRVIPTISPLLPMANPCMFFAELSQFAYAVVIDHWIGGDGSRNGERTEQTPLAAAVRAINPHYATLAYREEIITIAKYFFARVGVSRDGFACRFLPYVSES